MPPIPLTDNREAEIGARIRTARKARRLTMEHVAERCGVTYQQMQKYESGANRVAATRLLDIVAAIGCHPNDVLLDDEARRTDPATFDPEFRQFFDLPLIQQERVRTLLRAAIELGRLAAR